MYSKEYLQRIKFNYLLAESGTFRNSFVYEYTDEGKEFWEKEFSFDKKHLSDIASTTLNEFLKSYKYHFFPKLEVKKLVWLEGVDEQISKGLFGNFSIKYPRNGENFYLLFTDKDSRAVSYKTLEAAIERCEQIHKYEVEEAINIFTEKS